jgi:hypothetical protein
MNFLDPEAFMRRILSSPRLPVFMGLILVASYVFYNFMVIPGIWPDEEELAAPARSLANGGPFGSALISGMLPGADVATYWYPPGYFFYLASVFKLFGADIFTIRGASLFCGCVTLVLFNFLMSQLGVSKIRRGWMIFLMLTDVIFLRSALIGRAELLVLSLALASITVAIAVSRSRSKNTRLILASASGVFAAAAFIAHTLGLFGAMISGLVLLTALNFSWAPVVMFVGSFFTTNMPYLLYILRDVPGYMQQFGLQMQYKANASSSAFNHLGERFLGVWAHYGTSSRPAVAVQIFALVALAIAARRNRSVLPLLIGQAVLLVLLTLAGEVWYTVYAVPFALAGLGYWNPSKKWARATTLAVMMFFGLRNTGLILKSIQVANGNVFTHYSDWKRFGDAISSKLNATNHLPGGGTYLITINTPSPFLAFWHDTSHVYHLGFPWKLDPKRMNALYQSLDGVVIGGTSELVGRDACYLNSRLGRTEVVTVGMFTARVVMIDKTKPDVECGVL